jgi:hypothetical protein
MKTDLKVELFLIHQTYFTDNHGNTSGQPHRRTNHIWQKLSFKIGQGVYPRLLVYLKNSPFSGAA